MTLYSSGLFFVLTASGCIDNTSALPVSPSLQDEKTLAFGTTIHFVRDSKSNRGLIFGLTGGESLVETVRRGAACGRNLESFESTSATFECVKGIVFIPLEVISSVWLPS